MMREIKFRAWDKEYKKMWFPTLIAVDRYSLPELYSNPFRINEKPFNCHYGEGGNQEFMQYTGLKDKSGVEIYEGDICKTETQQAIIEFYCASFCFDGEELNEAILSEIEVIGNIYENMDVTNDSNTTDNNEPD